MPVHQRDASQGRRLTRALLLASVSLYSACGSSPEPTGPNVLFVVWDTVRADHLSLYGHSRKTTPQLDRWAEGALVFEDCVSTASSTVPSHGAMFTGRYPSEHGANNLYLRLDPEHETLAEIFQAAGYETFLYSANPHISKEENFDQGFDRAEHPWDPERQQAALAIVRAKLEDGTVADTSSELPGKFRNQRFQTWDLKASGELAETSLLGWLKAKDPGRPFFAFLNYMEAHRPYVPRRASREVFMSAAEVQASYGVDRSWERMWSYTFGLEELTPEELELTARTYDACLLELDQLFAHLLASLEAAGHLEDTLVVLVGDHGEHLGDQHMLDHQYSLYQGVVRVPLILWNPGRIQAGRSSVPVSNFDLFPTLLELCGLEPRANSALSLLTPDPERKRLAEYPSDYAYPIRSVAARYPDWKPDAWRRRLSAFYAGDQKLIWASDGRHELYDLAQDPTEQSDQAESQAEALVQLKQDLGRYLKRLTPYSYSAGSHPDLSQEQHERLEALGYFAEDDEEPEQR